MDIFTDEMIITEYIHPPIPDRRFDWQAITSDYEPGDITGWGSTEEEAIADLKTQLEWIGMAILRKFLINF